MSLFDLLGLGADGWGAVLIMAALMTIAVTVSALAIGAVIGAVVAWAKLSARRPWRVLGEAYTTIFRGVPELLVIYLVYFGGSGVATSISVYLGGDGFFGLPPFIAGALGVGVIAGAYLAEVYRGAYLAVARGEIEAARALGMRRETLLRRIVIPQVLRFALPGLGNVWQLSLKDSALVSVTGLAELLRTSQVAAGSTHHYFLFYIAGGALYLLMTSVSNRVFARAEARVGKSFRRAIG